MDIQSTNLTSSNAVGGRTADSAPSAINADFQTFLVMLTTQMQNQDPLNPLDAQDFATQLATFSGVEQQVRTNDLLSSMSSQLAGAGLDQMSGWIGREARVATTAEFTGQSIDLYPNLPTGLSDAQLVVSNEAGQIIQRIGFDPNDEKFVWLGQDNTTGAPLPEGHYTFVVEGYAGEDLQYSGTPEHYARVTELLLSPNGALVVLENGSKLPATQVTGLREALN